jgi:hypothetical protein
MTSNCSCIGSLQTCFENQMTYIEHTIQSCVSALEHAPTYWRDKIRKAPNFWWGQISAAPEYWLDEVEKIAAGCLWAANKAVGIDIAQLQSKVKKLTKENSALSEKLGVALGNIQKLQDDSTIQQKTIIQLQDEKTALEKTSLRTLRERAEQIRTITTENEPLKNQASSLSQPKNRLRNQSFSERKFEKKQNSTNTPSMENNE